jgi:cell division protein FtsI/penicillin-binding protein 2
MSFWKKGQRNLNKINNSRINLIFAIIFLLAGLIIYKLFNLQIYNYDLYYNLAYDQHQVNNQLEPERGRIFIQDNEPGSNNQLYPVATNKNFYLLYAVPKDIKEATKISEMLFETFKREMVVKEVDELLKKEDDNRLQIELKALGDLNIEANKIKQAEIIANHERLLNDKQYLEIKKIRREAEINLRKANLTEIYLNKLTKKKDVYEPLEQKVDELILKNFYLAIASSSQDFKLADLEIENNVLLINRNNKKKTLVIPGLGFTEKSYRFYPENNIGSNLTGFVGFVGSTQKGRYGLEEYFDQELAGKPGSIKIERDAKGQAIIINDREYLKAENGVDLILTINRSIQFMACKKLNEAVLRHGADGGSVIIMEVKTGAILAMCSNPDYDANNYQSVKDIKVFTNPAVFSQYEPGSIFKVLTMAMALDQEKITPQTTYNDTGEVILADYKIKNSDLKANGVQTMTQVLEKSLNTGSIFAMRSIGPDIFADYVKKFGFGEKTGIGLYDESKGDIKNLEPKILKNKKRLVSELAAATASYGQGIAVTPIQMVKAFGVVANGGIMMKPYVFKEIIKSDGSKIETKPMEIGRIISEKAATLLGGMMVNVVENGHGKRAAVKGYYVAGKTGTAQVAKNGVYQANQHIGSFAGFAPADDPKFVMLVRIDQPRDVDWAESSAAPLFGELAQYLLDYWQVPKNRDEIQK